MTKTRRIVFGVILSLLGIGCLSYGLDSWAQVNSGDRLRVLGVTFCAAGGSLIFGAALLILGFRKGPDPVWVRNAAGLLLVAILASGSIYLIVTSIKSIAYGSSDTGFTRREEVHNLCLGLVLFFTMLSGWLSSRKQ
jgi:hypothetical protein